MVHLWGEVHHSLLMQILIMLKIRHGISLALAYFISRIIVQVAVL